MTDTDRLRAQKPTSTDLVPDGFYWEEWRNGGRIQHGWHNGKTLSGENCEESFRSIRLTLDAAKSSSITRLVRASGAHRKRKRAS